MKKQLHLLIALLAATNAWAHDFAVENSDGVTIYYNKLSATEVEVTYGDSGGSDSYSDEYTGTVVIPSTVTYSGTTYSVISIGGSAFSDCSALTEVTIPNSVTTLSTRAFSGCTSLTSVTIPSSVTLIRAYAFSGCKYLSVDLSKSVATINADSFNGIKSLIVGEKVNVSGSVSYSGINNLVWLANNQPSISGAKVAYTASSLDYLSSWFKVDGFTYVPLSPSERTCILIDCDYIANGDNPVALPEKVT